MIKRIILSTILSCFSLSASAMQFSTEIPRCSIAFEKVSGIDFHNKYDVSFNNGIEGSFTVTANGKTSDIYVLPQIGTEGVGFEYGIDYVWMINDEEVTLQGGYIHLGRISGTDTREFKVYPKMNAEMPHAGTYNASIDVVVQCHAVTR